MNDSLRSHQVCRLTGISYRQLDYCTSGLLHGRRKQPRPVLVVPNGATHPAMCGVSFVVKQLMAAGSPNWPTRLRKLLGQIPREMPEHRWLVVGAEDGAGFATDDSLPRACVKYGPGCMVIDLQPVVPDQEKKAS